MRQAGLYARSGGRRHRAGQLIAATALLHRAPLITSDAKLRKLKDVATT
jgi:predicted nucleic acid-binding protein